nr:unnamed protein product [Spirometra erinaceieuropaei]
MTKAPGSTSPTGWTANSSIIGACTSGQEYQQLLFVDDCALNTTTEGHMQRSMGLLAAPCDNLSSIINTKRTVVVHRLPPNAAYVAPQIDANGAQLQVVDTLTHLGSTFSQHQNQRRGGLPDLQS